MKGRVESGALAEHRLRELFALPGFVRLLLVRWPSQMGDGMFQIGAAALLLFSLSPTEATSGREVAEVLLVVTLPFTIVGPFAGVVIDRWRRQRILVWSTALRIAALLAALPLAERGATGEVAFLAGAVLVLSTNRFFIATLGAVLPKVVPGEALVPANAIATIGGSIVALAGATVGGLVAGAIGEDAGGPQVAVVLAGGLFLVTLFVAATFPRDSLGPDRRDRPQPLHRELGRAGRELTDGVRRIARSRRAWAPIAALTLMRFITAVAAISALLVFRNLYGVGPFGISLVLGLFGVGAFAGAAGVTFAERRFGVRPETSLHSSLVIGGVAIVTLTPGLGEVRLYAVNLVLGVAFAAAKIPGDALVQSSLPDRYRGRVFAAYDVLYHLGWLAGGIVAGFVVADVAVAERALLAAGIGALAFWVIARSWLRRLPAPVDVESWEEAAHALDA